MLWNGKGRRITEFVLLEPEDHIISGAGMLTIANPKVADHVRKGLTFFYGVIDSKVVDKILR